MGRSFFTVSDEVETEYISVSPRKQLLLNRCNFCKKKFDNKDDIYMYRGDTPFCSEECRQDQIDIDEAMEKMSKRRPSSLSMKKKVSSTVKEQEVHVIRGASTLVAR